MVVLVTGANGQLGQALQFVAKNYSGLQFVFCDSAALDITNLQNCQAVFKKNQPNFCINAAAYTAVDKAESEKEKAYAINVAGAENIAKCCKEHETTLLHISTDFVFDGTKTTPYTENDVPNPTGVYGQTKLDGERVVQTVLEHHFIIRTSWVYSQFGQNFMKTMLRLAAERETLSVVNDQIGTPTHALDLANALIAILKSRSKEYGIYNFSNEGQCSWFDFAQEIFRIHQLPTDVKAIPTTAYPTPAKRPSYSVLDKTKIRKTFEMTIPNWETSLRQSIS